MHGSGGLVWGNGRFGRRICRLICRVVLVVNGIIYAQSGVAYIDSTYQALAKFAGYGSNNTAGHIFPQLVPVIKDRFIESQNAGIIVLAPFMGCAYACVGLTSLAATVFYGNVEAALTLGSRAGRVEILRGVTLEVARGETVGVVGPSGSGKSSLLMLMGGLEQATGGTVRALGEDLTAMDEDALARFRRDHMGVVFQSFHLIPTMTALENVATPLELAGRADAFDRAAEELKAVGLGARLDHYPGQLSGGEQQRVALARAAAPRPEILLADEPTGNLDGVNGEAIMDMLFGLRERHGATLIMVTHAPELAARHRRDLGPVRACWLRSLAHAPTLPRSHAPTPSSHAMPTTTQMPRRSARMRGRRGRSSST